MAKKDITIEGVKKAKVELESSITKLLQDFESTYDVKLGYVSVNRERTKDDMKNEVCCEPTKGSGKKRDIETVEINMELDLF